MGPDELLEDTAEAFAACIGKEDYLSSIIVTIANFAVPLDVKRVFDCVELTQDHSHVGLRFTQRLRLSIWLVFECLGFNMLLDQEVTEVLIGEQVRDLAATFIIAPKSLEVALKVTSHPECL
jgi:hypothetical protein